MCFATRTIDTTKFKYFVQFCHQFIDLLLMFHKKYRFPASERVSKPNSTATLRTKQKILLRQKYRMLNVQVITCQPRDLSTCHKKMFKICNAQSRTQGLQAFWSAGQRREDSGDIEFYYRRISAVKQWKPLRNSQLKKLNFIDVPRVFPALPR